MSYLRSIAVPFYKASSAFSRGTSELLMRCESKESLVKLCKELADENATLRLQLQQVDGTKKHLLKLESLCEIGDELPLKKIYARVIKRDISSWIDNFTINKGRAHGVTESAFVISACGVIGKIAEVSDTFASVILTSSPKFRLAVFCDNEKTPMIFSGQGNNFFKNKNNQNAFQRLGIVKNIPISAKNYLKKGTKIIPVTFQTSFQNLSLGIISQMEEQGDGLFLQATVNLPAIDDLNAVLVIDVNDL